LFPAAITGKKTQRIDLFFLILVFNFGLAEANEKEAERVSEQLQSAGISSSGADGAASFVQSGNSCFLHCSAKGFLFLMCACFKK
jgi:hypothetical protein